MPDQQPQVPVNCCVCNEETNNYTHYHCDGISGYVCAICNIPSNLITDHRGITFPTSIVDSYAAYDADAAACLSRPRTYFTHLNNPTFECCFCNELFYGDGIYIRNWDDSSCLHCADNEAYYDDDEGEYWSSETAYNESMDERESSDSERDNDTLARQELIRRYRGNATPRYLNDYTIGIEFEHAPNRGIEGATSSSLYHEIVEVRPTSTSEGTPYTKLFSVHGDGSIAQFSGYNASEIVTSAVSGHMIDTVIDRFYEPFAKGVFAPGPEHPTCGFHVHVESKFLMWVKRNSSTINNVIGSIQRHEMIESLMHIHTICNNFISQERRNNHFCNAGPAMRDKNMGEPGTSGLLSLFGRGCYPGIAIRSIGTIEFRIWPSTNSKKYMKARVELSQKLVEFFDQIYKVEGNTRTDESVLELKNQLKSAALMCSPTGQRTIVLNLMSMLGLSQETVDTLIHISQRFHPFAHGKTHFKFNDRQLACLRTDNVLANQDIVMPVGVATDQDITICDTTAVYGRGMDVYLTLTGAPKCYPPTNENALNLQKQYAKGDI